MYNVDEEVQESIRILEITYDEVHRIKGRDSAVIIQGGKSGLYDLKNKRQILPVQYTSYKYAGPALLFTDSIAGLNVKMFILATNKLIDMPLGISGTRAIGSVKAFESSDSRLLVLGRGNGRIIYSDHFKRVMYCSESSVDSIALSIVNNDNNQIIIHKNGFVQSLESYIKEKYKHAFLISGEAELYKEYLCVDNSLVGWKLNEFGVMQSKIGKVVNIGKLSRLQRVL